MNGQPKASVEAAHVPTSNVVTIPYSDLLVPKYPVLRKNLLELSRSLAALPEEAKKDLKDADSRYLSYCQPNLWPRDTLPELEPAFKDLGRLIFNVGLLLAYHCDKYVTRLKTLMGFPLGVPSYYSDQAQNIDGISSWCGWHTDTGSLTGLTCPMYMKDDGSPLACPDNTAGLYIRTRSSAVVKAIYGEHDIAYQDGEATEILLNGLLCATPHCVKETKPME